MHNIHIAIYCTLHKYVAAIFYTIYTYTLRYFTQSSAKLRKLYVTTMKTKSKKCSLRVIFDLHQGFWAQTGQSCIPT